jgi:hypothetical protein
MKIYLGYQNKEQIMKNVNDIEVKVNRIIMRMVYRTMDYVPSIISIQVDNETKFIPMIEKKGIKLKLTGQ